MSNAYGYHSGCSNCCAPTSMFLFSMFGIAGLFGVLWFLFWNSPSTLTQLKGASTGAAYTIKDDGANLLIYQNGNQIVSTPIDGLGLSASLETDLASGISSTGTTTLWVLLAIGLFGALALLWSFKKHPDDYVCCHLREPFEEMERKFGPYDWSRHHSVCVPPLPVAPSVHVTSAPTVVSATPAVSTPSAATATPGVSTVPVATTTAAVPAPVKKF